MMLSKVVTLRDALFFRTTTALGLLKLQEKSPAVGGLGSHTFPVRNSHKNVFGGSLRGFFVLLGPVCTSCSSPVAVKIVVMPSEKPSTSSPSNGAAATASPPPVSGSPSAFASRNRGTPSSVWRAKRVRFSSGASASASSCGDGGWSAMGFARMGRYLTAIAPLSHLCPPPPSNHLTATMK